MRALIQRVDRAAVTLPSGETRAVGKGLLILLGVGRNDDEAAAVKLADKCLHLRIFSNADGKFDKSLLDEKGELLVISQFTLYAEAKGGRRPDFAGAARPETAVLLYRRFVAALQESGLPAKTGEFAAHMKLDSVNDGPVTIWLDTERF